MTSLFLSYARGDDEPFARRLHADLTGAGFDIWFDRVSMPSRSLTFHQEIRDAIAFCDRLILIVGPKAKESLYVQQEWQFAYFWDADGATSVEKIVVPVLRLGEIDIIPDELKLLHCEDFRDDSQYDIHFTKLIQQLSEPAPRLGKLIGVPSLPTHLLSRTDRLIALRDALRTDLDRPVVITGAAARVGMHGMGGIGKSVLAAMLSRDRKIREAFPDGIVWVGFGTQPSVAELQRRLYKDLGGDGAFQTEHEGRVLLREILKDKSVLVILDDVWRRNDIDWFDILGPRCRAMITTRDSSLLTSIADGKSVHHKVELLSDAEALTLLAQSVGVERDNLPNESIELIAECGRLPLALALCGGLIHNGFTWDKVLEQLRSSRIDRVNDPHPPRTDHENIWNCINVSVKFLSSDEQSRFLELAVFPSDRTTPIIAIKTLWAHSAGFDDWDSDALIVKLSSRSLLEFTTSTRGKLISLHDLVCDYVHVAAGDKSPLNHCLLDAYLQKCPNGWPSGPNDGYFLQHLRHHLVAVGRTGEAIRLMMDFDWLWLKTRAGLVSQLSIDAFELYRDWPSAQRNAFSPWYYFIRGNAQFLQLHPDCFFQQAYNEPFQSPVSRAAQDRWDLALTDQMKNSGRVCPELPKSFLEWTNRPRIWQQPACLMTLVGHKAKIEEVAISQDGATIASLSDDGAVMVCDTRNGECRVTIGDSENLVKHMVLSADGATLVVASQNGPLEVWDAGTGQRRFLLKLQEFSWIVKIAVSGDGATVFCWSSTRDTEIISIWDARTGRNRMTLNFESAITVALSADGNSIVMPSSKDNIVSIADTRTGKCRLSLEGHKDLVRSIAQSSDGATIVSGSIDGIVKVWDGRTGDCRLTLEAHADLVSNVAVSMDGATVVTESADKIAKVWNGLTGMCRFTYDKSQSMFTSELTTAVSEDGRTIVSTFDDKSLKVWDAHTGECRHTLVGHTSFISSFAVCKNGNTIVSGSRDSTVKVWDGRTNIQRQKGMARWNRVENVALSGDGTKILGVSGDDILTKSVKIWDARNGQCLVNRKEPHPSRTNVVFDREGATIVSASYDHSAMVWDAATGRCRLKLSGHTDSVSSLSISLDGSTIVSGSTDGTVRVWDGWTGDCRLTVKVEGGRPITLVAISGDGTAFVACADERYVGVWDAITGERRLWLGRKWRAVENVALSGDRLVIYSSDNEHTFEVWDVGTGKRGAIYEIGSPEAKAALEGVSEAALLWQLRLENGRLICPNDLLTVKSNRSIFSRLTAPGPFAKAYGPLACATILAITAEDQAQWFRIRSLSDAPSWSPNSRTWLSLFSRNQSRVWVNPTTPETVLRKRLRDVFPWIRSFLLATLVILLMSNCISAWSEIRFKVGVGFAMLLTYQVLSIVLLRFSARKRDARAFDELFGVMPHFPLAIAVFGILVLQTDRLLSWLYMHSLPLGYAQLAIREIVGICGILCMGLGYQSRYLLARNANKLLFVIGLTLTSLPIELGSPILGVVIAVLWICILFYCFIRR